MNTRSRYACLLIALTLVATASQASASLEAIERADADKDYPQVVVLGKSYLETGEGSLAERMRVVYLVSASHGRAGRLDELVPLARKYLGAMDPSQMDDADAELYFGTLASVGHILRGRNHPEGAEVICRWVLDSEESKGTDGHRRALVTLGMVLTRREGVPGLEKLDLFARALAETHQLTPTWGDERNIIDYIDRFLGEVPTSGEAAEILSSLVPDIRRVMALVASEAGQDLRYDAGLFCEDAQRLIVDIHLHLGEYDAALFEAKVLFEASISEEGVALAIERLSRALRLKDGDLTRLNAVLNYLRAGRAGQDSEGGTDDDLKDPLESVVPADPDERDRQLQELLAGYDTDWRGRLGRGILYRFWGNNHRRGLQELWQAYLLCPVESAVVQSVADHLMPTMVQVSGDEMIVDRFLAFQRFGPAGPDGQAGTSDDLANPLDEYLDK